MPTVVIRLSALALLASGWAQLGAQQTSPTISVAPTALSFSYQIGTITLPAAQAVAIKHAGSTTALDYTITPPGGAPWLIVTPLSGKTGTSFSVRVNPSSLLAGTYLATLQVDATGAAAPVTLPVTLIVKNPPPTMSASSTSLTFTYDTDQPSAPAAQVLTVSTSGEPVSFTAAASGGAWLRIDKDTGIAMAGNPVSISVSLDTTGLTPGSYSGKISLASLNAANKSLVIAVTLTVNAGTAVISSIWPNAAPVGSDDLVITIRGQHLFRASVVTAGATTLTTAWVSTTVLLATVPKTAMASQGTLAVTVTNTSKPASNAVNFDVTAPGPRLQAVVNAASFTTSSPTPTIAPGEIIAIFGSGLASSALLQATPSGGAYPTTLGSPATIVEFELTTGNWVAAPLIFVHANQINAVAPFALAAGAGKKLRVTYNSLVSSSFTFDAVAADPGLFTLDASGRGQAAALNYNAITGAYTLNSASNAAARGSIIALYATGGGVTSPLPSPEGKVIPLSGQPPALSGATSVTIAGEGALVQSATLAPGSIAGLVQLNVTVPATLAPAKDHAVVVTVGGRSSPATATIAVK